MAKKLNFGLKFMLLINAERWAQPSGHRNSHLSEGRGFNERDKRSFNHAKHLLLYGEVSQNPQQQDYVIYIAAVRSLLLPVCWLPAKWDTPAREIS